MARIAIMQGRLVPPEDGFIQRFPRHNWRDEFALAAAAGLDAIEWIYDAYGESVNPLATDSGVGEMADLSRLSGVAVVSVCADYFMDYPFVRTDATERRHRVGKLLWLFDRCAAAGISRVVLPFVDQSRIADAEDEACVVEVLHDVMARAAQHGIELHLETALDPSEFAGLLSKLPHPSIKVNYDSGNSAALGYSASQEFGAYGHRIGSVHIKDRVFQGTTVPLGTGSVDFPAVFSGLRTVSYGGDFVLQVARAEPLQEVAWAKTNRRFLVNQLASIGQGLPQ